MITTFASEACSRCGDRGRGEAGEDRHLHRADVRAGVRRDRAPRATSGGRSRRGRPRATPSRTSASARRVTSSRELGERLLAARAVLAEPDRRDRVRPVARAQRCTQFHAMFSLAADEPGRPLGPAREVDDRVPRLRELEPHVLDRRGPEPFGIVLRARDELPVVSNPCLRMSRTTFARSSVAASGSQMNFVVACAIVLVT